MATKKKSTAKTLTTADVAKKVGTDPRTLRMFLRSDASTVEAVGKGSRYRIKSTQVTKLKKEFQEWQDNRRTRNTDDS